MSFHDMILSCYITLKNMASKKEEEKGVAVSFVWKNRRISSSMVSFLQFFVILNFREESLIQSFFSWRFLLSSHELLLNFNEICSKNYINNLDWIRRKISRYIVLSERHIVIYAICGRAYRYRKISWYFLYHDIHLSLHSCSRCTVLTLTNLFVKRPSVIWQYHR